MNLRASFRTAAVVLALGTVSSPAAAVPITYVHTGFGSGTLDGVAFGALAPVAFTITALGDTDNVTMCSATCLDNDNLDADILIADLGTFDFTTATRFFVNSNVGIVGFSRSSGSDLFNGPLIGPWDMLSSFGPVAGTGNLLQWTNSPVVTDGGVLVFNSGSTAATFTATVAAVPEPLTLALFGAGLAGLAVIRRRRKAKA